MYLSEYKLNLIDEGNNISQFDDIEDFETLHVEGLCTVVYVHSDELGLYVLNNTVNRAKPKITNKNDKLIISCGNVASNKVFSSSNDISIRINTGITFGMEMNRKGNGGKGFSLKGIDSKHPFGCLPNLEDLDSILPVFVIKKPFLKRLLTYDQVNVNLYNLEQELLLIESENQSNVRVRGSIGKLVSVYAKSQSSVKVHNISAPLICYANTIQQASVSISSTDKAKLRSYDQSSIKFYGKQSIAEHRAAHQSSIKFK